MEPITLTALYIGKLIAMKLGAAHLGAAALTALGAAAVATVIVVGVLTIYEVAKWFQQYQSLAKKESNVAITLKVKIEKKQYAVVQGIFDKNTNELGPARTIKYDSLDSQMRQAHQENDLVVYPV